MSETTHSHRCIHWNYFAEQSYYHHISSFFSLSTMAPFHHHSCWFLYFEVFLWFLLMDDCNQLLGLLITLEMTFLSNQIIAIYHHCFSRSTMAPFHCRSCRLLSFWSSYIIPPLWWLQPLVGFDDCIGNYFSGRSNYAIYNHFFNPITMASFHCRHFWLLYFNVFLLSLLEDECGHSFGSLITLELIFWEILLSPYIMVVFLPAQWRIFSVTAVPFEVLCWAI